MLKQCSDTLLPLREEFRQHNALSAAITLLLGRVRKRGLQRVLKAADLPLWQRHQPRRVSVGGEVTSIMAEALDFKPATVVFPEDDLGDAGPSLDRVDEAALMAILRREAPVDDLLAWLHRQGADWRDETTLRIYHEFARREDLPSVAAPQQVSEDLKAIRVIHHPLRIDAEAKAG